MLKRKAPSKSSGKVKRPFIQSSNPPITNVVYNGPIVRRIERAAKDLKTIVLTEIQTLTSTAGGVLNTVFSGNPSTAANWSDTNAVWGEYRLLGFTVFFMPFNRYSKSTTNTTPVLAVVDRRNATALSSTTDAARHASCVMKSLEDPWSITIKMTGEEEANFIVVSAPTAFQWLKLYTSGLSASTSYGYAFITYRVQFRNVE